MSFLSQYYQFEFDIEYFHPRYIRRDNAGEEQEGYSGRFNLDFGDRTEEWMFMLLQTNTNPIPIRHPLTPIDINRVTARIMLCPDIHDSVVDDPGNFTVKWKCFIIDRDEKENFLFESMSGVANSFDLHQIFNAQNRLLRNDWNWTLKLKVMVEIRGRTDVGTIPKLETLCIDDLSFSLNKENLFDTLLQAHRLHEEILFANCVRLMKWDNLQIHSEIKDPKILTKIINILAKFEFKAIRMSYGFDLNFPDDNDY